MAARAVGLVTGLFVLALTGCEPDPAPPAPPAPALRRPVAAPAPRPDLAARLAKSDAPWAPTRYAPALGLLAPDGLKIDVDPATGRETLFETDVELGDLALRRARTGDDRRPGLFGRGWRSELESRVQLAPGNTALVDRLQGRTLFVPVAGATNAWTTPIGEPELLRARAGGWDLVDAHGRAWLFDRAGQLTSVTPGFAIVREGRAVHVVASATDWLTLSLDPDGRATEARQGALLLARWRRDAAGELVSVGGARPRGYERTARGLRVVGRGDATLLEVERDAGGRVAALRSGALEQRYLFEADLAGRPQRARVDARGGSWTYHLGDDARWTIDTPVGPERAWFDARGRVVRVERADGSVHLPGASAATEVASEVAVVGELEEDERGRIVATHGPTGVTRYGRDGGGQLTRLETPAGRTWTWERDALGRVLRSDGPAGPQTLARDAQGRLYAITDAAGVTRTFERDREGRVTSVATDALTLETVHAPGGVERRSGAERLVTREEAGRVVVERGDGLRLVHAFDAAGETVTTPWGEVRREVGPSGQVERLRSPAGTFRFELDADGRRSRVVYPNGVTLALARDDAGRVTSRVARGRAGEVLRLEVERDARGLPAAITRDGQRTTYVHDAAERLTTVAPAGGSTTTFGYDADGARTWVERGGVREAWSVDGRARLDQAGPRRARHDAAGRVIAWATTRSAGTSSGG